MDASTPNSGAASARKPVIFIRYFAAPRPLVFKAWTDPKLLAQWWGPHGYTNPVCEVDPRKGGAMLIHMRGPEGHVHPMTATFQEFAEPERLSFACVVPGPDGQPLFEVLNTATFTEEDGRTKLVLEARVTMERPGADQYLSGMEAGWGQSLERFTELAASLLPSAGTASAEPEVVIIRQFAAPRALVFRAWTDPGQLARWWVPPGFQWIRGQLDLRPGGSFHYGTRMPDGREMWGKFTYLEIAAPARLVFISSFADEQGQLVPNPFRPSWPLQVHNIVTFEEAQGATTMTLRGTPYRAGELERRTFDEGRPGMQYGFKGVLDKLAELLAQA